MSNLLYHPHQARSVRHDLDTHASESAPVLPSDSWTELTYPFAGNEWLRERYRLGGPDSDPPHRCASNVIRSGLQQCSSETQTTQPSCTHILKSAAVPNGIVPVLTDPVAGCAFTLQEGLALALGPPAGGQLSCSPSYL